MKIIKEKVENIKLNENLFINGLTIYLEMIMKS